VFALLLTAPMTAAVANVITDWDEKAVSTIQTGTVTPPPRCSPPSAVRRARHRDRRSRSQVYRALEPSRRRIGGLDMDKGRQ